MIDLTDDEAKVACWAEAGNSEPLDRAVNLHSAAIRALLLGLPVRFPGANKDETVKIPAIGVRVKGATLIGPLNLVDGRGSDGGPMPALVLEACICPDPIVVDHARIRHLSLKGSRITHLSGRGVHIESTLDLTGLTSAETMATGFHGVPIRDGDARPVAQGLCWVELPEAEIDGAVEANGADFSAPAKRENFDPYAMPARYALDLSHAHIRACVRAREGTCAVGGVSVLGCEIGGDVRADGARLTGVEGAAFWGMTARIGGNVVLRAWSPLGRDTIPFVANGVVVLSGSKIAGDLEMSGARLTGNFIAEAVEIGGMALLRVWDGQADGRPHNFPFIAEKDVDFLGGKITGNLEMTGATLAGNLVAANAEIGGDAQLQVRMGQEESSPPSFSVTVQKEVNLLGAKIAGDLDLSEGVLTGDITADNVTVGGNLLMIALGVQKGVEVPFQALMTGKTFSFVNSQVTGAMVVDLEPDEYSYQPLDFPHITTIDLRHTHVGTLDDRGGRGFGTHCQLKLDGFRYDGLHQDTPQGLCRPKNIRHAFKQWCQRRLKSKMKRWIDKNQRSYPSWFRKPASKRSKSEQRAAYWQSIALFLNVLGQRRVYKLLCDHICYQLRSYAIKLQDKIQPYRRPVISLCLIAVVYVEFLLSKINRVQVVCAAGAIGLLYIILWLFKHMNFECHRWEARLDWLNLQYKEGPTVETYTPEPYEQLTKTFRSAGFYDDARKIVSRRLALERRLVTSPLLRFLPWLFGTLFDYGLSPIRAISTFLVCIVIGSIGVGVADYGRSSLNLKPAMVIEAHTVNTTADKDKRESGLLSSFEARTVNTFSPNGKPAANIQSTQILSSYPPVTKKLPCNGEIDPLSYAADVFVPALELHQDDKCVISPEPDAWLWRRAYALYAALGWIVTALTILTVSGILRRHVEE